MDAESPNISKPCFITVINAKGMPIIVYPVSMGFENELKFNVLSNISLDWFENELYDCMTMGKFELSGIKSLFELEGFKVYGQLVQQTGWRYVLGFVNDAREVDVADCFNKVREIVVTCKCNPFVSDQDQLVSQIEQEFKKQFT
ncbi:Tca17p Ecym_3561 [Eremothecium cymbalariae DBVPG|uniref:Uncharacterized protein n=1 Tax=Eremothecium cymbalariae (strain CBS 270.75 / DBVPG 7215 / KCTC 17166 / NRRL Y-17582) TaxID=931890 RepID=G8JQP8_ERECY|nr:Hypothetical protein Ecym_3561 [Eremothecium cymbalariae DBVPG\